MSTGFSRYSWKPASSDRSRPWAAAAAVNAMAGTPALSLAGSERMERIRRIARMFSEELPALTLFYRSVVFAHTSALTGLTNAPAESTVPWNIYEWELN